MENLTGLTCLLCQGAYNIVVHLTSSSLRCFHKLNPFLKSITVINVKRIMLGRKSLIQDLSLELWQS